jgi:hypothetical protein
VTVSCGLMVRGGPALTIRFSERGRSPTDDHVREVVTRDATSYCSSAPVGNVESVAWR